ncbi:MAG TPA: hypothetical protein VFP19_07490, partial [Candidatus Limnocylindrales bacterium]|nr:hypothetical protein [Candidatus Limnocylindrales bacterium]
MTGLAVVAGPSLSALAKGPIKTVARELHTAVTPGRTTDLDLPIAASHVVLHWAGNPHATVSVSLRAADGTYGAYEPVALDDDGPDPGTTPADPNSTETFGQVIVAEGATAIRVQADRPINHLTVVALDTL